MRIAIIAGLVLAACGADDAIDSESSEILGGTLVAPEGSGFVFLQAPSLDLCSGTLVTAEWILTAKHCFEPSDLENIGGITAQMGRTSANFPILRHATEVVGHPDLDLALVHLDSGFDMPAANYDKSILAADPSTLVGQTVSCFGYGRGTVNGTSGVLRTANLQVLSYSGTTLTVARNAQAQIPYLGDSGGTCLTTANGGETALAGVIVTANGDPNNPGTASLIAGTFLGSWVSEALMDRVLIADNGQCLDVPNDSRAITNLQTFPCNRNGNERWRLSRAIDGSFAVQGVDSGKCVDVPGGSSGFVTLQQYPCHGGENQRFRFFEVGDFEEIRNRSTGMCWQPAWNGALQQTTCLGSPYQQVWTIENHPLPGRRNLLTTAWSQCADVPGGSTSSGTRVQRFNCWEIASNQEWNFLAVSADFFKVRPRNSELCLDAASPVAQRTCAVSVDQNWRLQQHADFTYELKSQRFPAVCLSAPSGANWLSTAVCDVNNNDRWRLPWR